MSSTPKPKTSFISLINIIAAAVFIAGVSAFLFISPRPEVSETEQRKLTSFPVFSAESFFSGEFTDNLSAWFNDTVPFRDEFKKIAAEVKSLSGITLGGVEIHGNLTAITTPPEITTPPPAEATTAPAETEVPPETEAPAETTPPMTTPPAETTPAEAIVDGVYDNGQLIVYMDGHYRGMSMYGGGTGLNYASYVNAFKEALGDVAVYSMVIPTSSAFYTPAEYSAYNASHLDTILSIRNHLVNVTDVDAYSVLEARTDEPVYTRTDHHWMPLGAYYAAEEFAKTAGVPFAGLSDFTEVVIDGFLGTIYTFAPSANLLNDPEQFVYYKPQNDYTVYYYTTDYTFEYTFPLFVEQPVSQSYSTFMGGDAKIVRIETDVKNGRRLAVLKDSYGNAAIPFLVNSFEEIFVIDIRYFEPNAIDFLKEHEVTDVLFTMCTFSAAGGNSSHIDRIMKQEN